MIRGGNGNGESCRQTGSQACVKGVIRHELAEMVGMNWLVESEWSDGSC
jgi:hypothetical protein